MSAQFSALNPLAAHVVRLVWPHFVRISPPGSLVEAVRVAVHLAEALRTGPGLW